MSGVVRNRLSFSGRHRGLSLVELLVSIALGSFLLLGVINVFLASKESSRVENALARVQENGRFAMNLLAEDIRHSQYTGCNSVNATVTEMASGVDFDGIRGYERRDSGGMTWLPALPVKMKSGAMNIPTMVFKPRDGSDLLNLQMAERLEASLTANVTPASTGLPIDNNPGCAIDQNDMVIVSSCVTAHLFRVTNAQTCSTANLSNPTTLEFAASGNAVVSMVPGYNDTSEVMVYSDVSWYVADTNRDRNGFDVYALYRHEFGEAREEMLEGVEHMQLLFGQRVGSTTRFVPARDGNLDYEQVTGVRVALLIQSFERVRDSDDQGSYVLLDEVVDNSSTLARHSGGRAMRRVFQTTANLRNTAFDL